MTPTFATGKGWRRTQRAKPQKRRDPLSPCTIDFRRHYANRVLAFPVAERRVHADRGHQRQGFVRVVSRPKAPSARRRSASERPPKGVLESFSVQGFEARDACERRYGLSKFLRTASSLVYRAARKLRILRAGEKPDEKSGSGAGTQKRVCRLEARENLRSIPVWNGSRWRAKRGGLQREYFWTEDMSQIDWHAGVGALFAP